jgi:NAD(P)-dependent dehydrogenase (short-subunit alcohol dehydrogenase family)
MMKSPEKRVVVITGASRGIGRGIARACGAAGDIVYLLGRTHAGRLVASNEMPLPGTLEEAAAEVSAAGGTGHVIPCDLAVDAEIEAAFAQIGRQNGHIDILVNNAAFIHRASGTPGPFWKRPVEMGNIIDVGLRCHFVASWHAAPLLTVSPRGLVVNISFFSDSGLHDPAYCAAKAGLDRLTVALAEDFKPFGVAALSLWPGIVATERVRLIAEQLPWLKDQLPGFETPDFLGLVIRSLYEHADLPALSGKVVIAAEWAARHGIKDLDGKQPVSCRAQFGPPPAALDVLAMPSAGR